MRAIVILALIICLAVICLLTFVQLRAGNYDLVLFGIALISAFIASIVYVVKIPAEYGPDSRDGI